jgi:hypothetical protein
MDGRLLHKKFADLWAPVMLVSLASAGSACRMRHDENGSAPLAETFDACMKDGRLVANGEAGCQQIAAIRVASSGRRTAVEVPPTTSETAAIPDHGAAIKAAEEQLRASLPPAAGTFVNIVNLGNVASRDFSFEGKISGGGKLELGGFVTPFSMDFSKRVRTNASVTVSDGLTLFLTDVYLATDGYTWPVLNAAGEPQAKRWLPAHIRLQIWHTTKLTRGKGSTEGVAQEMGAKLGGTFRGVSAGIGVSESGSVDWGKSDEASYSIRRVFPLATTQATSPGRPDDARDWLPMEVRQPFSIYGFVNQVLNPWFKARNLPPLASVPCKILLGTSPRDVYYYDESIADESKRLSHSQCYDLDEFWTALTQSTFATKGTVTGQDLAAIHDILGWMRPHQPQTFPEIEPRVSWWDSILLLDGQDPPQPASLRVGDQTLPWEACVGTTEAPSCEKEGLVPWTPAAGGDCKCVPSVGLHTRNTLAREALPSIRAAESGIARGSYGERIIPNYTAKADAAGKYPVIQVVHGCWCDINLQKIRLLGTSPWMTTDRDIMFVPPAGWDESCDALHGMSVLGVSYTLSSVNARLYECARFEAPDPRDAVGGANSGVELVEIPAEWVGGKHIKADWRYFRSGSRNVLDRGRIWFKGDIQFGGKVGDTTKAGSWNSAPPQDGSSMLNAPETWEGAPQEWKDF